MKILNQIIASLNKNELGYFKKRTKAFADKEENLLANLLDDAKKHKKISARHTYELYWQLTDSLYDYYSSQTHQREIHALITVAENFLAKGKTTVAQQMLYKALAIAEQNNSYLNGMQVIHVIKKHLFDFFKPQDVLPEQDKLQKQLDLFLAMHQNEAFLLADYNKIYTLVRTRNLARNEDEKTEYKKIITHPIYTADDKTLSPFAILLKYNVLTTSLFMCGENQLALEKNTQALHFFRSNKKHIRDYLKWYAECLNNHFIICSHLNNKAMHRQILAELNELQQHKWVKNKTVVSARLAELNLLYTVDELRNDVEQKDFASSLEKTEHSFALLAEKMPESKSNMFRFMLAEMHLKTKSYKQALSYLRAVLNSKNTSIGIASASRFLEMIILFEKGDFDFLESRMRSVYRFLKQNSRLMRFEQGLLQLLSLALSAKIKTEHDFFVRFKAMLLEVLKDENEKKVLEYFDYLSWVNEKLNALG